MNRNLVIAILSMMMFITAALVFVLTTHMERSQPVRIALTNWPGFDYLYLAGEKGYFEKRGLNIELVPINSITDMLSAYERNMVDGYTGTVMDVASSMMETNTPSRVVLATDFSEGGDMVLALPPITSIAGLRGKSIGVETTSAIEKYVLIRALASGGLTPEDVTLKPYSQAILVEQINRSNVDAVVSYTPYSTDIMQAQQVNKLFDSSMMPGEIADVVVVSPRTLEQDPDFAHKLLLAWQDARDYADLHPEEVLGMFAARYGIPISQYRELMTGAKLMDTEAMQDLARSGKLALALGNAAKVLGGGSKGISESAISETISIWTEGGRR